MDSAVACLLIPRFPLLAGLATRQDLLSRPLALAPEPGGAARIGQASGPAEAFGVRGGMSVGEALARCPELALIPPDPARAQAAWERVLRRLEGIGAAVESVRPGEAFFEANGLRGLCGGHLEGVIARARRAVGVPSRIGVAPNRFCAHAAAQRSRARRAQIVPAGAARAFLAPLPVATLAERLDDAAADGGRGADLVAALERLGVRTLGELAGLSEAALADRFGRIGLHARRLASGGDDPLRPRRRGEELVARLELPDAASGEQLNRALELLIDRLLAEPGRRGRTVRRLALMARLAGGGGWRTEATLRRAGAAAERLRLVLAPKLAALPAPASALELRALELGPPQGEQPALAASPREQRRERLGEAVRQVRAAAGRDALLKVVEVDPDSRVPERRAILTPFPAPEDGIGERRGPGAQRDSRR